MGEVIKGKGKKEVVKARREKEKEKRRKEETVVGKVLEGKKQKSSK